MNITGLRSSSLVFFVPGFQGYKPRLKDFEDFNDVNEFQGFEDLKDVPCR